MLYLLICFLQRLNKITIFLNCYFGGFLHSCILFLIAVNPIFWERKRSDLLRKYYTQPQLTTEAFETAKDTRERINRGYSGFKPGRASWWSGKYCKCDPWRQITFRRIHSKNLCQHPQPTANLIISLAFSIGSQVSLLGTLPDLSSFTYCLFSFFFPHFS